MSRYFLAAALFVLLSGPLAAQSDSAFVAWARDRIVPMDLSDQAFRALDAEIAEARLIGVGESVHEVQTFLTFRLQLLQHLVRHQRVTALVLESGLPEAMTLDDYVRGRTATVDFDATLPGGFGSLEEIRHTMEWLREWNLGAGREHPVGVYGADLPERSGSMVPALDRLEELTAGNPGIKTLVDAVRPLAGQVSGHWWREATDKYGALPADAKAALASNVSRLVEGVNRLSEGDADRLEWTRRVALVVQQNEEMLRLGPFSPTVPRDRAMADNTLWVLGRLAPGERAVYWAHNAHVQRVPVKGPPLPPGSFRGAGMQFGETLGKQYYAIATAYGGPAMSDATAAESGSVDAALESVAKGPFLLSLHNAPSPSAVASWLSQERLMRFQVGYLMVPLGAAFDAVAYFDRATPAIRAKPAAAGRGLTGKLTPCRVPEVEEEILCGQYEVYENRAAGTGRKISLNIVVLPAKTPDAAPDPLVFLAGGGVVPATRYAGYFSRAFSDLRQRRDVLLIDQRGSGASNPLECELSTDPANAEYRDEARFVEAVRRCRKELERTADLRYYTTPFAMDDLDEVRGWLGYPRLNLLGVSYGTQAAMVYLRQHPERVRSLVLHGVLPFDVPVWLEYPRSAQQALDQAFAACARQQGCHDTFPNLAEEFSALLKRLEKPVKVKVSKPETSQEMEVPIDAEILRVFVSSVLYSAERIHDLPLLIHLAHTGDYQPLARRLASRGGGSEIPKGVYFSIVCSEEVPQFDAAELPAATAGTFMGGLRIGREVLACGEWMRGWLPEGYRVPVQSSVPALILNGALDHVTPPRYGERVARSFTNSRHLVLPNRGHNDTDPCVAEIEQAFIAAGSLEGLDTSCLAKTEDLFFALRADQLGS